MGVSTDAILFYGYIWDDDVDILHRPEDSYDEWTDIVAKQRGLVEGDAYVPYEIGRDLREEYGVDIGRHGSDSWSCPYLYVLHTEITANRGYPRSIDEGTLHVGHDWQAKLEKFAMDLEIELPQVTPQWWMASYWG